MLECSSFKYNLYNISWNALKWFKIIRDEYINTYPR
jgi:hypothetical protein